jgi:hypothetical protein
LLAFSIGGENIWTARYLGPALPAILLLIGALVAAVPPQLAVGATAAILGVLAVGTGKSFEARYSRADYQGAARFIESVVTPRDVVLDYFLSSERPSERSEHISPIGLEYKERHRNLLATPRVTARVFGDPPARGRVVVAGVDPGGLLRLPQPAPDSGLCLIRRRSFAAGEPVVEVRMYAEAGRDEERQRATRLVRRRGSEVIRLSSGIEVPIEPATVAGQLEGVRAEGTRLMATGWALDEARRPAGCVLVFVGGRLLASGPPTVARADVARVHGPLATSSGFELSGAVPRGVAPQPRAFVVAGDGRAAELESTPEATTDLSG